MKYIIGIDEAGRGPLAGPITLSAFVAPPNLRNRLIRILGGKIKDSKRFSPAKRYTIYHKFLRLRKEGKTRPHNIAGQVFFFVSHISNKIIDSRGISKATQMGIKKSLQKLHHIFKKEEGNPLLGVRIRLDGSLKAPREFKNQKTIIGGDDKDIFIACASIVSKVRRDRLMRRLAKKYPNYCFEAHKGYGTTLHYKLIKKFGISEIHRKSFLKNLTILSK